MIKTFAPLALLALFSSCAEDNGADRAQHDSPTTEVPQELTEESLAEMSVDEIWDLGVARLHWDPAGPPEDASKAEMIAWFLTDESIKDIKDTGYIDRIRERERLREFGYRDGDE